MIRVPPGVRRALEKWMRKRQGTPEASVQLHYRQIYIVPTRQGMLFALMLLVMWLGSINYSNSMGFMLTFLLGGMFTVAILHTFRNLQGLRITAGRCEPVFAGERARFPLDLENADRRLRPAIALAYGNEERSAVDVSAARTRRLAISIPTTARGVLRPGRFTVESRYPTGLFRAWSRIELDTSCLVYPRPEAGPVPAPRPPVPRGQGRHGNEGDEDFRGLRRYQAGDSFRHLAWKAVAQGRDLQTKQFSGGAPDRLWLDWDTLEGLDTEARLGRLTRWIVDAEAAGRTYGLRLPTGVIPPASGRPHADRCLTALALFPA